MKKRGACADDAEVVGPLLKWKASASGDATIGGRLQCGRRGGRPSRCGRGDWLYARTDRTQGHNRGVNPLATWKCGRRGGRPSQGRRMCGRRGGRPSPLKCRASASGDATIRGNVRTTRRSSLPHKSAGPPQAETPRFGTVMGGRRGGHPSP
jgi:hypothetical protein